MRVRRRRQTLEHGDQHRLQRIQRNKPFQRRRRLQLLLRLAGIAHHAYGKPSDQVVRVAEEIKADLIVLGAHAHSAVRRRIALI